MAVSNNMRGQLEPLGREQDMQQKNNIVSSERLKTQSSRVSCSNHFRICECGFSWVSVTKSVCICLCLCVQGVGVEEKRRRRRADWKREERYCSHPSRALCCVGRLCPERPPGFSSSVPRLTRRPLFSHPQLRHHPAHHRLPGTPLNPH